MLKSVQTEAIQDVRQLTEVDRIEIKAKENVERILPAAELLLRSLKDIKNAKLEFPTELYLYQTSQITSPEHTGYYNGTRLDTSWEKQYHLSYEKVLVCFWSLLDVKKTELINTINKFLKPYGYSVQEKEKIQPEQPYFDVTKIDTEHVLVLSKDQTN